MCNNDDNDGNKFSLSVKTLDLTCWRSTSREGATMGSRLTTHSEKGHDDENGNDGDTNERFLTKTSRCGLPPLTSWKARPSELDETYWLKLKEVTFGGNLMIRRIGITVIVIILLTQQNSDVITISIVILMPESS